MKVSHFAACCIFWLCGNIHAATECPAHPQQASSDSQRAVKFAVGKLGVLRAGDFSGEVRRTTVDLMGKLPQADRVYLEQMMFAAYCSSVRDDESLTGPDKSRALREYAKEVRKALNSSDGTQNKNQNSYSIKTTYKVCVTDTIDRCPPGIEVVPCGTNLTRWAEKKCAKFYLSLKSTEAGGRCGTEVLEVECKMSENE